MNLSKATIKYIEKHPSVKACLSKGLINYSALTREISKELGVEKDSSFEGIMIAIRRFAEKTHTNQDNDKKILKLLKDGKFEVSNKISVFIIDNKIGVDKVLETVNKVMKNNDDFHLIQGTKTITLILDDEYHKEISGHLKTHIIKAKKGLVQITHKTSEKIEETTGFLTYLTSIFSENGVNIYEALSSWTDSIFIIDQKDASKIFNILNPN